MKYKITINKRSVTLTQIQLRDLLCAIKASTFFAYDVTKETVGDVTVEPVR